MDSNKELWQLFQSAKKGNDEAYEQLCNDTYDVVYNLVAMIYEKEENRNKLVKHIFTKMRKAIASENIDDKDVLRWVAQYEPQLHIRFTFHRRVNYLQRVKMKGNMIIIQ